MINTIEGGCLCGAVRFRVDMAGIMLFNTCYCINCQKNSGTGFTAQLQLEPRAFEWLQGQEGTSSFESSPGVFREFCTTCGSRVPRLNPTGVVAVPAGLLDADPGVKPEINIYVGSKRGWAMLDESIESLPAEGSAEFWKQFMESKSRDA